MHLLIQAYKYPPVQAPSALRLYQLTRYVASNFEKISIQTSNNAKYFKKDESLVLKELDVFQIKTNDLRAQKGSRKQESLTLSPHQKQALLYRLFAKLYHSFPFVYFTGDGAYTYMRESYKKAVKLIEEEGITHILSSYRPWADHIVCYRLKKKFPHLIWIADFRDLAIDPVRKDVWWPGLQRYYQKRLLKKADIVTTVSNGLAQRLEPFANKKIVVVRNGLAQLPAGFMTAPLSNKFTITYTGSLYPKLQSAALLFECLRALLNDGLINITQLELQYAGKDGLLWEQWTAKYSLSHLSTNLGLVSLNKAKKLQANSQMNLLLSWSAKDYGGIMTAKLADYLYAGRPIIALLNGSADPEFNQLIEATGGGKVYPSDEPDSPEQLRTFLLDAYRTWQFSGALPWQVDSTKLKPYTWAEQVKKLTEVL